MTTKNLHAEPAAVPRQTDKLSPSICVEDVCVSYPDHGPDCEEPPHNADNPPSHEAEDAGKLAEPGSGDPGRADQQNKVDGLEIEVLKTVQIPART